MQIRLPEGQFIDFRTADAPQNLYGQDVHGACGDEVLYWPEAAYVALRTTLTATNAPLRLLFNAPPRTNWTHRLMKMAQAGADPNLRCFTFTMQTALDAGLITVEAVEQARRDLPESEFRRLYLNETADDGSNPFGIDHIGQCIAPKSAKPAAAFGIDLGRSVDFTVVIGLDEEGHVCHFGRWKDLPWQTTEDHIAATIGTTPALIDATGVGDPIWERLASRVNIPGVGGHLEPFRISAGSKPQLIEPLIVAVQQQVIHYPDGTIVDELKTMEATRSPTSGYVSYAALSGLHDDCVIALALAWRIWQVRTANNAFATVEIWDV